MMRVLVVEPGRKPYVKRIQNNLESLQKEVGGYIQAVYPFEDPVAIVCNEEAKLCGMPLNRALRDEDGRVYDIIAGTFMITGLSDEDFCSLTPQLLKRYEERFYFPEQFIVSGDKMMIVRQLSAIHNKAEDVE